MSYQKKIILRKTVLLKKIFPFLLLMSLIGCKPSDKENETQTSEQAPAVEPAFSVGTFSYLRLTKESLVHLFADQNGNPNGQTKKILLQFVDDNTASNDNPIRLMAYGATVNNIKTSDSVFLEVETDPAPVTLPGIKYMGNLEITRKQLNVIFGNDGNPPLGSNNTDTLYFRPDKSSANPNYVIYFINKVQARKLVADVPTNPSPPAIPCPSPCD